MGERKHPNYSSAQTDPGRFQNLILNKSPKYSFRKKNNLSVFLNIDVCENSKLITQTIIEFAKKMRINTVAEYVHSSTVASAVKELGIDYSQGFYIDEPRAKLPYI